jgi:hypothetical protein
MSVARALDEFVRLSDVDGCFIGFQRSDGKVLQFVWNADGTLNADVPEPGRNGSMQATGTWEEFGRLIEPFAMGENLDQWPGFQFQSWV